MSMKETRILRKIGAEFLGRESKVSSKKRVNFNNKNIRKIWVKTKKNPTK